MGADTARHYQWYPWHNAGHYDAVARAGRREIARSSPRYYREGLERVVRPRDQRVPRRHPIHLVLERPDGVVRDAGALYRRMTGDTRFREYEQAAIDWLFGTNPWGTRWSSAIRAADVGRAIRIPLSRCSSVPRRSPAVSSTARCIASIFANLRGIALTEPDEYAPFNTGFIVYHDDLRRLLDERATSWTARRASSYLLSALAPTVKAPR